MKSQPSQSLKCSQRSGRLIRMHHSLIGYLVPVSRSWPQHPFLGLCYSFSTTLCCFFNRPCPYQLISATCPVLSSSCLQLAHSFCFLLVSTSPSLCVCWLPLLSPFDSRQLWWVMSNRAWQSLHRKSYSQDVWAHCSASSVQLNAPCL